jgi:cystathionine beta-lyase/cystathionine gamma-synthase
MASIYTTAVHAGEKAARAQFTPVTTPIYSSSSFYYADMEMLDGTFAGTYDGPMYTRYGNPTVSALESAVAALEESQAAMAYSSGMAAIHGALLGAGVRAGMTVVAAYDVYGATYSLLKNLLSDLGIQVLFADASATESFVAAIRGSRARAVVVETISNPLLKIPDLPRIAETCRREGAALIVDNTFATPYLCRPAVLGADYVVHSATKYLGGHGDVLGGVVATSLERRKALFEVNKLVGGNLGPQEAWLVLRGLKTLPLRMHRQCDNAARIADWLSSHAEIVHVNYPGLRTHPQHDLAARLLERGLFGAMISFDLRNGDRKRVFSFMEALKLVLPATSLGDVYSLALYPSMSSHRALDAETRRKIGIGDGLVRLSIGIEDVADIIEDLNQALAAGERHGKSS